MAVLWIGKDRENVEQIWELWIYNCTLGAEIGMEKKKLTDKSKA